MIRSHNAGTGLELSTEIEDGTEMSEVMGNVSSGEGNNTQHQEPIDLASMVPSFFSE